MQPAPLVWDVPTRLFHWLLVISIVALFITGWLGGNAMLWHGKVGIFVSVLIVFRLLWGLVGASTARWSSILTAPFSLTKYLRGQWTDPGHNPLGALSVIAMIVMLIWQAGSGLFAYDDIAFRGPLARWVSTDTSLWLTGLHKKTQWLLLALIICHVLAVTLHQLKGHRLVQAMLHGRQPDASKPAKRGSIVGLVLVLIITGATYYALLEAPNWLAAPPPPAPAADLGW